VQRSDLLAEASRLAASGGVARTPLTYSTSSEDSALSTDLGRRWTLPAFRRKKGLPRR
jgi:hypothetical protein